MDKDTTPSEMAEFLTMDNDKLDYSSRLSGLLLNEGTDVLRWFLLDNLPRTLNAEPDLKEVSNLARLSDYNYI